MFLLGDRKLDLSLLLAFLRGDSLIQIVNKLGFGLEHAALNSFSQVLALRGQMLFATAGTVQTARQVAFRNFFVCVHIELATQLVEPHGLLQLTREKVEVWLTIICLGAFVSDKIDLNQVGKFEQLVNVVVLNVYGVYP